MKKGIKFGLKKDIVVCHTRHEGSMDPVKAVIHLEKECEEKGIEIVKGCHVRQIMDDDNPVHLKTTLGTFSATRVALCTNALSRDLYPGLDVRPAKNQVYVTSRIRHSLIGTYHMDKGFVYFRPVGDRVLIGGGRHLHRKNEEGVSFDHRIEDFLKETLGSYLETDDEIRFEYKWIGHIGIGQSKEPLVSSNLNGVIHGVRLSGMGVALAPVLAKKIVNLILDNLDA
ncbi:MAG: FAD-dependent oxidoreductase [Saprospiraceae bacterium]|nr:FAD-dependent oxidoreductase [Saprospiraceae bacterium]